MSDIVTYLSDNSAILQVAFRRESVQERYQAIYCKWHKGEFGLSLPTTFNGLQVQSVQIFVDEASDLVKSNFTVSFPFLNNDILSELGTNL